MKNALFLTLAIAAFLTADARAQGIFSNPITGTNPNTANPYTAGQVVDPNITATGIGRGAGINGANTNDRYNATGYDNADLAASIADNAFFTFTLTPNPGASINFSSITFTLQASGTGPTNFALLSSLGGFVTANPIATSGPLGGGTITFTISDGQLGAAFDNVASAVEFRLYGYGATGASGTGSVNDFAFNGVVTIPEPATWAMIGGGFLTLVGLQRWKARRR